MKKIPEGKPVWCMENVKSSNDPTSRTFLIIFAAEFYQLPPCPLLAIRCRRQKLIGPVFR